MSPDVVLELAPMGVLRAGINVGNFLLVTGRNTAGDPEGIAPDMASAIADRIGARVRFISFANPGEMADAASGNVWDIALLGAEPQRAEKITFSPAYAEIPSTYLVPSGSTLKSIAEVDSIGIRIVSTARTAYDLWLERNIRNAELVRTNTVDEAFETFVSQRLDALAGLKARLLSDIVNLPGARILDGQFAAVQQAIGTPIAHATGAAFVREFVEEAKLSGLVARLIAKHKVRGLSVAPRV